MIIRLNLSLSLPFISIGALFFYFLTYDSFVQPNWKIFRDIFFFAAVFMDLGYRLFLKSRKETENAGITEFGISGAAASAFVLNFVRNWLDISNRTGISQETSMIPRFRDFLLILIILLSI
ncbi:MAG TPA: hypothetical protein PL163_26195, partial [Leptospiraceae bacterium]|nr:hypothetical protein [Leptospiraceae bacterium]